MKNFSFLVVSLLILTSSVNSQIIQWQQLNGPHGGTAISFASNASGDIFAGAEYSQNGVNRSTDGGFTWLMCSSGIQNIGGREIGAILVTDNNNIIIGTRSSSGGQIYRSTDNGNNWYVVANDFGAKAFAKNLSGEIYAYGTIVGGYIGGMHKSADDGVTWEQVLSVPARQTEMDIAINDSGHIFITGSSIWRSTDNALTWEDIGSGYIGPGVGVTSIAINDSGHIFVGCTQEYASNSGILKSTDNGETWIQVKMGIRIGDHHNIVINSDGHIFAGSYGWGVWKSTDNGVNWIQYNTGLQHLYICSMHISNGVLYAGTEGGGIYRSDDWAENWVQVGFSSAIVQKIAVSPLNGNLFTAVSGVSRSTDSGQSWEPVNYGLRDYGINSFAIKNDGTIFCCTKGSNQYFLPTVYRSTNNGNTWVVIDTGLSNNYTKIAIILDQQGNPYVLDVDAVYKSTNNGDTWFSIGGPGGAAGLAFNSSGDLFAIRGQSIWRKLYGDTNWVQLSIPFYCNQSSLFISSNDYIYTNGRRSTDNGETWTQMSSLEGEANVFVENSIGHLYAGHGTGVYRSTDDGENWTKVNDGLTFTNVLSLGIDSDGFLYAGTKGRSIFKTVNPTTNVEVIKFEPTTFYLEQNFPNPFNPSTKIKYSIPQTTKVKIKVFDILGNEIETLINEEKSVGTYELTWNAESLPCGVYFYQLRAGAYTAVKKMILIK